LHLGGTGGCLGCSSDGPRRISRSLVVVSEYESIKTKKITRRHEWAKPSKYILDPVPHSLEQEIADYEKWSTKIVNRDRPDNQKKRAVTFANHRGTILRAAGYLVKYRGLERKSISLSTLTEPENAINFIDWFIEQQGRFTASAGLNLARLIVLGKYLSIIERSTEQRKALELRVDELKTYRTVKSLRDCALSLRQVSRLVSHDLRFGVEKILSK
jgi:hypothetical protein